MKRDKTSVAANMRQKNKVSNLGWNYVPIGEEVFNNKEFENLISLEVLTDYTITKNAGGITAINVNKRKANEEDLNGQQKSSKKVKLHATENNVAENNDEIVKLKKNSTTKSKLKKAKKKIKKNLSTTNGSELHDVSVSSTTEWTVLEDPSLSTPSNSKKEKSITKSRKNNLKTSVSETRKVKKGEKSAKTSIKDDHDDSTPKEKISQVNMEKWSNFGLSKPILRALEELKFTEPTPIQNLTLPASVLGRKDIVGAAETGSGKTLAFGIPIVEGILSDREHKVRDGNHEATKLKALILTPTRELAVQIKNHIEGITKYTDIKTVVVVGGLSSQKQERLLKLKPEIVIATPGRLWELMESGHQHLSNLNEIKFLAVDETDRMVERGHFQELEKILQAINENNSNADVEVEASESPKIQRQTFVFSATLAFTHNPPTRTGKTASKQKLKKLSSKEKLQNIMEMVGIRPNPKIVDITNRSGTCTSLVEMQIQCPLNQKDYYLHYFLTKHPGRTIVFCNSINCVRRLANLFSFLHGDALPLHSEMHQKQRLKNLERFSANDKGILIATDVAARGLDIPNIQHVIHYQIPRTAESYVHRSGRTARAFKDGLSVAIVEPSETFKLKKISDSLEREENLPVFEVNGKAFRELKARVDLAIKVEKFEHTLRKQSADLNWKERNRKEMDLATSDESSDDDQESRGATSQKKEIQAARKQLEKLKLQLSHMLNRNIF